MMLHDTLLISGSDTRGKWRGISRRLKQLKVQVQQTQNALAFSFIEVDKLAAMRENRSSEFLTRSDTNQPVW